MAWMIKAELQKGRDGLSPSEREWLVVFGFLEDGKEREENLIIRCPIKVGFPDIDDILRSLIADSRRVPGTLGYD
jgi:hypothetical protein